ncbi:MAG: DNA polymerase III subunit alpha [Candidatus Nanopelagicales bacterium]
MPADPFVHLHVASGYSLRHGASSPAALAARAAELGQEALALTDRDGLYGAVRFVLACRDAGIAPILGLDLAVRPVEVLAPPTSGSGGWGSGLRRTPAGRVGSGPTLAERAAATRSTAPAAPPAATPARRTPARGGAEVDPRHPRVVLLARGRTGWASLCRLVSAAHLGLKPDAPDSRADATGQALEVARRGAPVTTLDVVAAHSDGLVVLLGPDSEVGRALASRRPDLAEAALAPWRAVFGRRLAIEVVSHRARDSAQAPTDLSGARSRGHALSSSAAARSLRFARDHDLPAVLTNAVRHATRDQAPVVDVLDAVRRLVPIDSRHLDRANGEGHLADGAHMERVAQEVVRLAGLAGGEAGERQEVHRLLADTRALAEACRLDPVTDLGIGEVHVPELDLLLPARTAARSSAVRDRGPAVLAAEALEADRYLRARCDAAVTAYLDRSGHRETDVRDRLDAELETIAVLGFAGYFLTVGEVVDLIKGAGVRVAARGSGAGSLVNHLLGISGVDPLAHGLLMERFLSPLRRALPDIDVDVESARRTDMYEVILERFGGERCACVSMRDTYRVRHAVRDVGAALGMPPGEIDAFAKAFPHIRARDARAALDELPELRTSGLGRLAARGELDGFLTLVEALDGLPRHIALHPCGVLLSDTTLLDRTPVEASWMGFPMSQFDKDDVEELGLLKLDVLGIRMQSSMAYAVQEIERVDGVHVDLDSVPLDDDATYALVRSAHTLGCFQIESPGQRELIGKFAPETFGDLITDISLFRPGPVKSDMVTPFLRARQGWNDAEYLHPDLRPALEETHGVVVFHEQVLRIVAVMTGCTLAEADEVRRTLGSPDGQQEVRAWFYPAARGRGYDLVTIEKVWEVLKAFASFGFCKAHAAAFALPTYHSTWLKAHHPAHFLAGVLTHDPGMYPKRLILDDARNLGIAILPLDVNASEGTYRVERISPYDEPPPEILEERPRRGPDVPGLPDGSAYGIRLSLADVKGISEAEVERVVAGRPYGSLSDFWHRAAVSRPVVERLVVAGAFDSLYGIGLSAPVRRRGRVTRRDLLLQVADLDRHTRATARAARAAAPRSRRAAPLTAAERASTRTDVVAAARRQAQSAAPAVAAADLDVQLTLDLGDAPGEVAPSGLPEMTDAERVRAELEVLGLDASRHVVDFYLPMLDALGVTPSRDLLARRNQSEVLVAGVKVATQTPPVRSGRRVVFLTLDDSTGPVDATFFEDVQGPYAATVFGSWLLLVRGVIRRTGPRGISIRATGAWELGVVHDLWRRGGVEAVRALLSADTGTRADGDDGAIAGRSASRSSRPVMADVPAAAQGFSYGGYSLPVEAGAEESPTWSRAGGMGHRGSDLAAAARAAGLGVHERGGDWVREGADGQQPEGDPSSEAQAEGGQQGGQQGGQGGPRPSDARPGETHEQRVRRILVHASGFQQSPYADIKPQGVDAADTRSQAAAAQEQQKDKKPPSKLWHSSPGSSGW